MMVKRVGSVTSKKKLEELREAGYTIMSMAKLTSIIKPKLIKEQGGTCAICPKPLKFEKRSILDHDHRTKLIRGVLCDPCNLAIGIPDRYGFKPDWFRSAAEFLEREQTDYVYPESKPKAERRKVVKKPVEKTATRHK